MPLLDHLHNCAVEGADDADRGLPRLDSGAAPRGVGAATELEQRWERLARQGKWMIAVYRSTDATKVDVLRINRAHLNDRAKVRIEAEVGCVVTDRERDVARVDDRRVLDVPVERILWYEIIDDIGSEDVPSFNAALAKGLQASREIEDGEPLTSADAAWRRPR